MIYVETQTVFIQVELVTDHLKRKSRRVLACAIATAVDSAIKNFSNRLLNTCKLTLVGDFDCTGSFVITPGKTCVNNMFAHE